MGYVQSRVDNSYDASLATWLFSLIWFLELALTIFFSEMTGRYEANWSTNSNPIKKVHIGLDFVFGITAISLGTVYLLNKLGPKDNIPSAAVDLFHFSNVALLAFGIYVFLHGLLDLLRLGKFLDVNGFGGDSGIGATVRSTGVLPLQKGGNNARASMLRNDLKV